MPKKLKPKPRSKVHVGSFDLGWHCIVDLFVESESEGGSFNTMTPKGRASIIIGLHRNTWGEVVSILLHEALELALTRKELRLMHSGKINHDTADFLFHFDHSHFGRVCSETGLFMAEALPKLAVVYKKQRRK